MVSISTETNGIVDHCDLIQVSGCQILYVCVALSLPWSADCYLDDFMHTPI